MTALRCDLRWKVACGLPIDHAGFHPTTLTVWRQRLRASELIAVSLTWFSTVDIGLALVNVLPVAPLDGGRVVRAIGLRRRLVRRRGGAVNSAR